MAFSKGKKFRTSYLCQPTQKSDVIWACFLTKSEHLWVCTKGHLILKCLFGDFNSPKKETKTIQSEGP